MMRPVILLGTERSGTNLLRRHLVSHRDIASPPPAGLVAVIAANSHLYLKGQYGDKGMEQCVKAALALIRTHPADWEMDIDVDSVLARLGGTSHWDLFRAFNEYYAEQRNATIWFSKEPDAVHFFDGISKHFPEARFIYLVRDGRDVAASMLKGGVHEVHVLGAARRWQRDQAAGMRLLEDTGSRQKIHFLRYEDFLSNHEAEVLKIFDFIGCSRYAAVGGAQENAGIRKQTKSSALWENLEQPVRTSNFGQYRKALRPADIALFESIAGRQLEYFGYETGPARKTGPGAADRLRIKLESVRNIVRNRADRTIRREQRIRRDFQAVVARIRAGKSFD
jgi:hypothetical protein